MPRPPDTGRHAGSSAAEAFLRPLRGAARPAAGQRLRPQRKCPRGRSVAIRARRSPHRDSQERRQQPPAPPEKVTSTNKTQLHLKGQRRWGRTLTMSPQVRGAGWERRKRERERRSWLVRSKSARLKLLLVFAQANILFDRSLELLSRRPLRRTTSESVDSWFVAQRLEYSRNHGDNTRLQRLLRLQIPTCSFL